MTQHHTIPQHLKPAKNVIVPVCLECHKKINENDIAGLFQFAYKIEKNLDEIKGQSRAFKALIENLTMNRIKNMKVKK